MKSCDLQIINDRCYYKLHHCSNDEFMKIIEYKSWLFKSWKIGYERKYFSFIYINRDDEKVLWSYVGFAPILIRYLQSLNYLVNGKELFRAKEIEIGKTLYEPWDFQFDAIQTWIKNGCFGLVVMPTGCITGDSIIYTNKGLITIKELYDRKYKDVKIMNYNGTEIQYNEIDNYYNYKDKEVLYIRTKFGFEIECTSEHKIVSFDENGILKFIEAGNMKIGNVIPLSYGQNCFGENVKMRWNEGQTFLINIPDSERVGIIDYCHRSSIKGESCKYPLIMNEKLAEFLGYYISEGNLTDTWVQITNTDKKINQRINYLVKNLFDCDSDIVIKDEIEFGRIIRSVGLVTFLSRMNLDGKSKEKYIPDEIMKSSKNVHISFLRALYDGDGCIVKEKNVVDYTSMSKKLCKQVQLMLLNLGILSSWSEKNSYCNDKYCGKSNSVTIYGDSVLRFKDIIGFNLLEYRQNELIETCKKLENMDRWTQMIIPNIHLKIKEMDEITRKKKYIYIKEKYDNVSYSKFLELYGFKGINMWCDGRRSPSKQMLKRILEMYSNIPEVLESDTYKYLINLCYLNVEYDSIEYIEKRKSENVYDLTIKNIPHYISNGYIVHNSGKTFTACNIINKMKVKTIITVHTNDLLINAWLNTLVEQFGEDIKSKIGIIGGKLTKDDRKRMRLISDTSYEGNVKQNIVIATSQSLINKLDKLVNERFGLLVTDECHHYSAEQFAKVASHIRAPYRLGLTATVNRPDGTSPLFYGLLGDITYRIKIRELVNKKVLVEPIFNTIIIDDKVAQNNILTSKKKQLDLSRYVKQESASSIIKKDYILNLARTLVNEGKRFIMYTDFVEEKLNGIFVRDYYVNELNNSGIKVIGVSSDMSGTERQKIFSMLQNNEINGIIFGKLGAEGVNIPYVDSVIMNNATKSTILFPQRVGRAMRSVSDKSKVNAYIYEILLNTPLELRWNRDNFYEYQIEGYEKKIMKVN